MHNLINSLTSHFDAARPKVPEQRQDPPSPTAAELDIADLQDRLEQIDNLKIELLWDFCRNERTRNRIKALCAELRQMVEDEIRELQG